MQGFDGDTSHSNSTAPVRSDGKAHPVLASAVFEWARLIPLATAIGERRDVLNGATAHMDSVSCHVTTLRGGTAPHPPHRHEEEELIIVREGSIEVTIEGTASNVGAGSVVFFRSNDLHGMRNTDVASAVYYVIRWRKSVSSTANQV